MKTSLVNTMIAIGMAIALSGCIIAPGGHHGGGYGYAGGSGPAPHGPGGGGGGYHSGY